MTNRNETIDCVKGIAIMSVISAHCNAILDTQNRFALIFSLILQNIGNLGVICFFVISGILFHYRGKCVGSFFTKKIRNIIIPWCISATCVYLYVYLRKPPITMRGYLNFIFGNGSYCYYLTVLMILYILFVFVPIMRKNVILMVCMGITVFSTFCLYDIGGVNAYLNIFNWIGYFALGVYISENQESWIRLKRRITLHIPFWLVLYSGIYITVLIYQVYHQSGGGYWNGLNVIFCWIGSIVIVLISIAIEKGKDNLFKRTILQAGRDSFGIYLWHMPIAGIIARVMNIRAMTWLVIIRPIIVLLIMLTIIKVMKKIMFKMKHEKYLRYLGFYI